MKEKLDPVEAANKKLADAMKCVQWDKEPVWDGKGGDEDMTFSMTKGIQKAKQ